jgi:hypothetical protein
MRFTSIWTSSAAGGETSRLSIFRTLASPYSRKRTMRAIISPLFPFCNLRTCNTQSFPVVCDSPSPGTSWRNRENPAPLRAHASATIGTETVANLVKVRRLQLRACLSLLCGRETHASTTQSDLLVLPTRNGPYRKDRAPRWGYLFLRVQHPPP